MLAEYGICVMVMNPERVRSSEDHSPKKLMLSEEIIAEKSGGETSSRDGVYEVFVYPLPQDRSLRIGNQNWTSRRRSVKTRRVGRRLYIPQWLLAIPPPLSRICTMRVS